MVLEEVGADYELVEVDISKEKPRDPAFLKLNPNGWVPVLVDGDMVLHESAAIVMYLCDRHPEAGLAPAPDSALRGLYYQWLLYLADTVQIAYQINFYPERHSTDAGHIPAVMEKARERLDRVWGYIDDSLGAGPYFLGNTISACDLYAYMLATWHPAGTAEFLATAPNLARVVDRVTQRPAVRRAMKSHGLA
jgi:glutathione S-transferase